MIGRLLLGLVLLGLLALAGLTGFAYLGPMQPARQELRLPVTLPPSTPVVAPPAPAPAPAAPLPELPAGSGD